jgi:anthranilate synthase/aminodeoxychorismate synthase-like glutamine amidotransferase
VFNFLARRAAPWFHRGVRLLFLENEDSFSWNVIESLPVEQRDIWLRPGREVAQDPEALNEVDFVIIGPGPTDPIRAGIVEVVRAVERARLPLLGICLGYQAIGVAFGASLVRVPPVHGKQSTITFSRSRLLPHFTGRETVMRYHSLALSGVNAPLRVIAQTKEGIPMAIEHETLPMIGFQFHPDSFGSPRGKAMIADFFDAVT